MLFRIFYNAGCEMQQSNRKCTFCVKIKFLFFKYESNKNRSNMLAKQI